MEVKFRPVEEKDFYLVERLIRECFWDRYRPGCYEHYLVHRLHQEGQALRDLEYVGELDGEIVAHIIYSRGIIESDRLQEPLFLGPVCVREDLRRKGIGSALIRKTLDIACRRGYPAVFLAGNPGFFWHFGFVSASMFGIYPEKLQMLEPYLMVKELKRDAVVGGSGKLRLAPCYTLPDAQAVKDFDREFMAEKYLMGSEKQ